MNLNICILQNEFDDNYMNWAEACKKKNFEYVTIDLTKNNWLEEINRQEFDVFLTCPSGRETLYKNLYDERLFIINKVLNFFCYPDFNEVAIHENKKFLSYWLKANDVPHPETYVFYEKNEALDFVKTVSTPLVAKFNIGASGKGVQIFRNKFEIIKYINAAFSNGIRQQWGPNLKMGDLKNRIIKLMKNPNRITNRIQSYKKNYNELQKGFVIFQEYVPHDYEWRIAKIGDSYFGHQKVKQGDKASGTKGIDYITPSDELLDFVKKICDTYGFNSMAVDLFENPKGGWLVNEMQTIFGHVQSYICEKDGKPGRYRYIKNKWVFEEGMFNTNLSYDLRLENVIKILNNRK